MQKRYSILPVLVLLFLVVLLGLGFGVDRRANQAMGVGKPFPAFLAKDIKGRSFDSKRLQGKITLWHVWASWCHVCEAEWPLLLEHGEGVQWVGMEYQDTKSRGQHWLAQHGDPFNVMLVDMSGDLAFQLGVTGVPETLLVDTHGLVIAKWEGPLSPQRWQREVLPAIQTLRGTAP